MKEVEGYEGLVLVSDSPHISRLVAEMRDAKIQQDGHRFRHNAYEIGRFLAYETEKREDFKRTNLEVKTTMGTAKHTLRSEDPIILNILRAANPLVAGAEEVFRESPVAFLDAKRKEGTYHPAECRIDIELQYASIPVASFEGRVLLIPDIMLASGSSLVEAYQFLTKKHGRPRQVAVNSVIAARPGIEQVIKKIPHCRIYAAAIDDELNENAYIVPGLGDAGDLCYNESGKSFLDNFI